jgi:hypothetical protein
MEASYPAPLTPEQLAAMNANGGFASCEDPVTHTRYHIVQYEPPTIGDDHVRKKLAEAQADMDQGRFADWNVSEIKRELSARLGQDRVRD